MKQRFLALFLAIMLVAALVGCGQTSSDATPDEASSISPLLYKVTDADGDVIWLFGSIHVGTDNFYPLPQYVTDAYNSSDALAVEVDIVAFESDLSAQMTVLSDFMYTLDTGISKHISAETYEQAKKILEENNMYNSMMDIYKPMIWYSLVENCLVLKTGLKSELGIDRYFLNLAKNDGKEVLEIESAQFQYDLMGGFSEELQILLLDNAIASYNDFEAAKKDYDNLITLWSQGDETAFGEYLCSETEVEDEAIAELYKEYTEEMITSRNNSMTEYAKSALESGDELFICVGAAHIVGEDAMADQLRDLGYTVEIIK